MPAQQRLRRRAPALGARPPPSSAPVTEEKRQQTARAKSLRRVFYVAIQMLSSLITGATVAASISHNRAAVALFVFTILATLLSLVLVFMSIFRKKDLSPVYMPDVHNPDGTIVAQTQMTVHDHDVKVANYFCRELPAMGMAAAWFYLWSDYKPPLAGYTAFVVFRLHFHPLFRIHLWREEASPELGRPFGAVPLFDRNAATGVRVVEGATEFNDAIRSANKDTLVVVDCSATWCGPCKQMAPVFDKLAQELSNHTFLSIDVDISRDVATNLAISSVPSFIIFKNGQKMEMIKGASPEKLRDAITSYE